MKFFSSLLTTTAILGVAFAQTSPSEFNKYRLVTSTGLIVQAAQPFGGVITGSDDGTSHGTWFLPDVGQTGDINNVAFDQNALPRDGGVELGDGRAPWKVLDAGPHTISIQAVDGSKRLWTATAENNIILQVFDEGHSDSQRFTTLKVTD